MSLGRSKSDTHLKIKGMCAANSHTMLKRRNIHKLANSSFLSYPRILSNYTVDIPRVAVPFTNYWTEYFKKRMLYDFPRLCKIHFYSTQIDEELVDSNTFEKVCEETLDSLAEYFEELIGSESLFEKGDIIYGAGVLTVDLGKFGTYVINRQSPNRQIWLSSPVSGPKRYDYSVKNDCWIYRHDGNVLHDLLENEISCILKKDIKISRGRSNL